MLGPGRKGDDQDGMLPVFTVGAPGVTYTIIVPQIGEIVIHCQVNAVG